MSVSSPFCAPSLQVGVVHIPLGPQIFEVQSVFFLHLVGGDPPSTKAPFVSLLVLLLVPQAATTEITSAPRLHAVSRIIDALLMKF